MVLAVALAPATVIGGGCAADEVRELGWEIEFADATLGARAVFVEGRILEGGCSSRSVRFSAEASRGSSPEAPPRLEAGRYGFDARARDEECVWFAAACVEVDVPRNAGDVVRITLESADEMVACAASACAVGRCGGAIDAGPSDAGADDDAGSGDAGRADGGCFADEDCGECMACVAGSCAPDDGTACAVGASPGTCRAGACCSGCWSAGACVAGAARAACGTEGAECVVCSGATPFCDGACVPPSVAVDLAVGAQTACAVTEDGALWCWGSNVAGQLGDGTSGVGTEATTPRRAGSAIDWIHVGMGDEHACGVRASGSLWCWGDNEDGQLGTGDQIDLASPARVDVPGVWARVMGASGGDHTCALKDDGSGWCMGQNNYGQLGLGDLVNRSVLTLVDDIPARALATGHRSTCAIPSDGSLWCWGENTRGQLGLGTSGAGTDANSPQRVALDADWTAIAAGDSHACGVRAGGELYCWGYNSDAQLGIGSTTSTSVPTRVGTGTTWRHVSAGLSHSCAIRGDGTLWCWGRNDAGQLGIGTSSTTDQTTPRQVGTASDWDQIHAGDFFTCGLRAGAVYCWGANTQGQLAQGDRLSRSGPALVTIPR